MSRPIESTPVSIVVWIAFRACAMGMPSSFAISAAAPSITWSCAVTAV
jgi:hypothetical protein